MIFNFDAANHEYIDAAGCVLPHITGMLEQTGWIDDRWYTEESCERGKEVHRLTASYDLGALDVPSCVSRYRAYLLAHVKAMGIERPDVLAVEEPVVHPRFRFGGRPDRTWLLRRLLAVGEVKTGAHEKSHQIQTALQAILVAVDSPIPPEHVGRFALYLRPNGKFTLEEHRDRRDFDEAYRVIKRCC